MLNPSSKSQLMLFWLPVPVVEFVVTTLLPHAVVTAAVRVRPLQLQIPAGALTLRLTVLVQVVPVVTVKLTLSAEALA
jgi:hypothetical protein